MPVLLEGKGKSTIVWQQNALLEALRKQTSLQ